MSTKTLVLPLVHAGGTDKDNLVESYCLASDALHVALEAVEAIIINQRDYCHFPEEHWQKAIRQRIDWMHNIRLTIKEIQTIAGALVDGHAGFISLEE
jgi:hypothetical protein